MTTTTIRSATGGTYAPKVRLDGKKLAVLDTYGYASSTVVLDEAAKDVLVAALEDAFKVPSLKDQFDALPVGAQFTIEYTGGTISENATYKGIKVDADSLYSYTRSGLRQASRLFAKPSKTGIITQN